ncbi:MAG TPA: hypothetical protein VFY94_11410 [Rhodanobacteraceae bacterium]|jgi:hypothetical protein|nr:hypothetical protein [Rhodanobacteraceae bacterium]
MKGIRRAWGALACLAACAPAWSAGFDLAAGPSLTSSERTTVAVFASVFGESPDDGRAHVEPIATVGWVGARNTRRDDLNHEVFLAGGGVRVVAADPDWFLSEQLAATSTRTDALSSGFEFMTSAGWQHGHFVVMLRHISNAHLFGGKNLGETMLLAGIKF